MYQWLNAIAALAQVETGDNHHMHMCKWILTRVESKHRPQVQGVKVRMQGAEVRTQGAKMRQHLELCS